MKKDILGLFENVKRSGTDNQYMAKCPAHDDRENSLAIKIADDGRVMLHCFAGTCGIEDICSSLGITIDDLFPEKRLGILKPTGKVYNPYAILKTLKNESLLVAVAALELSKGNKLDKGDLDRLLLSVTKLKEAYEYARK